MKTVFKFGGNDDTPGRTLTLFNIDPPREGARVRVDVNGESVGPEYYADTVTLVADSEARVPYYLVQLREEQ